MKATRRGLIQMAATLPALALGTGGPALAVAGDDPAGGRVALPRPIVLPDKANFVFTGTDLNAAYTHPVGDWTRRALEAYLDSRQRDAARNWPAQNSRDEAVALFAGLINAAPGEVAVVPSTLEGENLIGASLGLGPGKGVVTDAFHYDASLVRYSELNKRGMPLTVVRNRGNRIDYSDLEAAISPETRLVAVSWVSSATGYRHDLKRVCDIAHRKGALVYADIIQGVGAVPLDVKDSGVDFCCAGSYKWLMGEFGVAFLYVRPDRLAELQRVQLGWRAITAYKDHFLPFDPPGPVAGDYRLGTDTAQIFEVSTPDWAGLAAMTGSLKYLKALEVARIAHYREPMLDRLQRELPRYGFEALTPDDHRGPYLVFSKEGVGPKYVAALKEAKIYVTLTRNRVRISPSVYNDMADVEKLIRVLAA
ncbi:MAG: aminotransferase class V-fold PLP-dependent enzyme [Steroidobacteraceae bacterium]